MACRFRFAYFEKSDASRIVHNSATGKLEDEIRCRQLLYDIERVDHEAMEFGLDIDAFMKAFGPK